MTDLKFDIDGIKLSSEEINTKKDFDSFYKGFQIKSKSFYKKKWFWASTGFASIAITSMLILGNSKPTQNSSKENTFFSIISKEQPFIQPPFEELSVEGDIFKVNTNKGGVFKNKHGSIIRIPKFAFLNKKRKVLSNQIVDIKFTEYKDVVDQIISGIPMNYDSAGVKYMFSSAGMIKIGTVLDDSTIILNPEKPIEIEIKSQYSSGDYSFYCLNKEDKKWDYLGKDSVGISDNGKLSDNQFLTKFPEIQESNIVIPDNLVQAELQKAPEYQKSIKKRIQIQKEIELLNNSQPYKPIKADKNAKKFRLDIIETDNPELVPYKDIQFQLTAGEEINPKHTHENWNKVNLKKTEGKKLIVTFSKTNSADQLQYIVIPVLEDNDFEKAHKKYINHMSKIKTQTKALSETEKKINFFKKKIRSQQVDKAITIAKLERLERIATFEKTKLISNKTAENVTRYFKVADFGIFNSDKATQLITKDSTYLININFRKQVNELLTIDVFPSMNGIFSRYALADALHRDYEKSVITIGISNKEIGILKSIDKGRMEFKVLGKPKSKRELVKWLNI